MLYKDTIIGHAFAVLGVLASVAALAQQSAGERELREALDRTLHRHTIDPWYPRVIDRGHGGYFSKFDDQWNKRSDQEKFIVTQARHVWTLSTLAELFPQDGQYLAYAGHGYRFLRDKFWDDDCGGFYQLVDRRGHVPGDARHVQKRAYGNAFGLYALSAYYRITGDKKVLELAIKAFRWLEDHARDPVHGGYYECLARDGSVITPGDKSDEDPVPWNAGLKDYNSSIHLLEAFAELYRVWPDALVRTRLEEMVHVVADIMVDERGFLRLYFHPDWRPVTDPEMEKRSGHAEHRNHITFGHDVETAYLISESLHLLGQSPSGTRRDKIKRLVDHSLSHGWDPVHGGFFDMGRYDGGEVVIIARSKSWWAQAEGLNALHLMAMLHPNDPQDYASYYERMWRHIDRYLLDHTYGGWYPKSIDTSPEAKKADKAGLWKGNYHTARSLINCLERNK